MVDEDGRALFQFHYGTIKSNQQAADIVATQNFNSTMVRLKALDIDEIAWQLSISIPLWYD